MRRLLAALGVAAALNVAPSPTVEAAQCSLSFDRTTNPDSGRAACNTSNDRDNVAFTIRCHRWDGAGWSTTHYRTVTSTVTYRFWCPTTHPTIDQLTASYRY
jgi:hypothetical protein